MFFMKRRSLGAQLLVSFIIISIIPLVLVNLFSYYNISRIVNENNHDLMDYNLNRTKTALDISIESYEDILYQLYADDEIVNLINRINNGNEEGTFNFTPWLWSTGATSYEMDSEGGIKALTFAKDMIESGAMSKECINWTQGDVMNQFISGNVAMMINGPWQIPTMKEEAPDLNWKVALIPKDSEYASVLGGENYAVIDGGNEEGALEFLQYATAQEQVEYLMDSFGYISADKTIAEGQFTDDEAMKTFTEELNYAKARGPLAEWPEISDAISLAFNQVMTGAAEPTDAAKTAQQTIDGIVK